MNKKWFLTLMGSLLAVFLVTGCNADDQDPPPEDDGIETPGEDINDNLDNDVTPEEDIIPGDNNGNDMDDDGNLIEDDNNDGDLDVGKDDNDELGNGNNGLDDDDNR